MNSAEVEQTLLNDGLVAIVRGEFSVGEQEAIAEALLAGGVRILEITLNTTDALTGVRRLNERFPDDLLVGAGTVRTAADARRARAAGAQFLVAPGLDLDTVAAAQEQGTLMLPGVFTATEAMAARAAGCRLLKLFPADALGPSYLKALRAPLDDVHFVPTGGVDPETLGAFHRSGAAAFGVGSYLVKNVRVTAAELEGLTARARLLRRALDDARGS